MKKIIYFLAGALPTTNEAIAIAKLQALTPAAYVLDVRRTDISTDSGGGKEAADYVAGTVPSAYSAVTVINPDVPPAPGTLPATQAVVSNGVDIVVPVTGTYATKIKATVAAGVITGFVMS